MKIKTILPYLILLTLWEVCSFYWGDSKFPHISSIIKEFIGSFFDEPILRDQGDKNYIIHLISTIYRFVLSMTMGSVTGLSLALIFTQNKVVLKFANILVEFFRVIPPLILIPFLFLSVGAGVVGLIVPSYIYCSFAIFIYSTNSIINLDRQVLLFAKQFHPNLLNYFSKILLPAVMPIVINSLNVVGSLTIGVLIVSEYLEGSVGIGSVMKFSSSYADLKLVFVGIIWSILIVFAYVRLINYLFKYRIRWHLLYSK